MGIDIQVGRRVAPINWTGVREQYIGKCSAVCRTLKDCEDLVRHFGDGSFAPYLPVMVMVPGAPAPTLIAGFGYATAAELQDCAVVTWHQQSRRLAQTGAIIDFDDARDRHGLLRREEVDTAVRQALRDRIARHKRNPISDPFRQPVYDNPTGRTVHQVTGVIP